MPKVPAFQLLTSKRLKPKEQLNPLISVPNRLMNVTRGLWQSFFSELTFGHPVVRSEEQTFKQHHEEKHMTTIVENAGSDNSAAGMLIGIVLTIALLAGGFYFYNNGGFSHTDVHTTNVFPAAPAAPSVNITTPAAPATPAAPEPAPAQ
jgi:hypothetical protein